MKHEPDILVLPETWNVGFFPAEHLDELADKNGERTQEMLSTFAKNNNVNIVGGTVAAKIGNDILNRSYVFNREGKIAETFDKIHGFSSPVNLAISVWETTSPTSIWTVSPAPWLSATTSASRN